MESRYLTVHALTKYIKRKFDADPHLHEIMVKGEISNFKQHSSGHMYFTLKDEKARILAVMFARNNQQMKFKPENGMKVLIKASITVYESSGQYQMYVSEMQPDGIGQLYLAYEQLRAKLEQEGMFRQDHKKAIPKYPRTIGVITSPTGAAIRDIITTIKRRYPIAKIMIYPALVQGETAAPSIVKAVQQANEQDSPLIDVLIVGRGGGSIEELWAFNEEIVARAIYTSNIPVISAVGHETDFTICDFVADMRAPTPTGAAELAVPHIDELVERILTRQSRLIRGIKEKVELQKLRLNRIQRSYAFRYPKVLYDQKMEQLDKQTELLTRNVQRVLEQKHMQQELIQKQLVRNHPNHYIKKANQDLASLQKNLVRNTELILQAKRQAFLSKIGKMDALSPLKIMERGYNVAYDHHGKLIASIKQVKPKDQIELNLADGMVEAEIIAVKER
ncbi:MULTISPECIES: exodeoxyribonuclease VII large subunit [Bacillaceae]|jgi:exodeoxyribonuclease VII large subunit|uniref:exodeoxyribonuclease VII large subunit n=1 Tax=Bacillaceae TaxID=186817 RepID=UPI0004E0C863|nr:MULTISPECIES: exodeoxyribonuclease VII large subunit [Bacillaceae]MCF2650609.1 exodeoxyribonuclease VII large subunit [Niallia circulans]CAI9388880.1 Exodeoxyribonuclease 7 large subunit [Bacillus sp. T2.9-1]